MKRLLMALVVVASIAGGEAFADSYRSGSQVVTTGDSEGRLRQVVGKPDRETPIESSRGGLIGYRLEYFQKDGKSVQFEIVNGRVSAITQIDG